MTLAVRRPVAAEDVAAELRQSTGNDAIDIAALDLSDLYVGHFALTLWMHSALADAQGARVVSLSSSDHLFSPVIFDDLHFNFIPYTPFGAYGQSKTAEILMVSRPRVSDVVNKKTAKFTIDTLVEMLSRVGKPVKLAIS